VMNYGKFWMYDKYIVPGGCAPYPWTPSETTSRTTFEMFHVHGDPTMDVWTWMPTPLSVSYSIQSECIDVTVTNGSSPVEGAFVCILQHDGVYEKGLTTETGSVSLSTIQASLEEVTLTVTAQNHLYHQETFFLNRAPEIPEKPQGPSSGKPGLSYLYYTTTTDQEGDSVYYLWDWGNGEFSEWLGPFNSGETMTVQHAWPEKGTYQIRVKAKDSYDAETDWSEPLDVTMPVSYRLPMQWFWDRFFQWFPHAFPILRQVVGY